MVCNIQSFPPKPNICEQGKSLPEWSLLWSLVVKY